MPTERTTGTASIQDHFLADHRRLESLFDQILSVVAANDRREIAELWCELESRLLAHLAAEERDLIPELARVNHDDAAALLEDHRRIRTQLLELGTHVELHTVRLDAVRNFIDALRQHAKREDKLLYGWVDAHLDHARRSSVLASFGAVAP